MKNPQLSIINDINALNSDTRTFDAKYHIHLTIQFTYQP